MTTTSPEKTVSIFRDTDYEKKTAKRIDDALPKLQAIVDEFYRLDLGELLPGDLYALVGSDPEQILMPRWESRQEVPAGMDREAWLKLKTKPSFITLSGLRADVLNSGGILHHRLYTVIDRVVHIDEDVKRSLVEANNITLQAESRHAKLHARLVEFAKLASEINQLSGGQLFKERAFNNMNPEFDAGKFFSVVDRRYQADLRPEYPDIQVDVQKFKTFLLNHK